MEMGKMRVYETDPGKMRQTQGCDFFFSSDYSIVSQLDECWVAGDVSWGPYILRQQIGLAGWVDVGAAARLNMNSMKLVIPLHSLYWSIHTKDESKRGTAFAFIFGVN